MTANIGAYVGVSLLRAPGAEEMRQASMFVDVFTRPAPVGGAGFWRGTASAAELHNLLARFVGASAAHEALEEYARQRGVARAALGPEADAELVYFVETELAGVIGAASAHIMVASVVKEEALTLDEVRAILDEASQVVVYSRQLEQKSRELEAATAELRTANERLQELDRMKDDFISTVTHELRTPLTSIRAISELMLDAPEMDAAQRATFLRIVVAESERLSRLVNQVLDMAKFESGLAEWHSIDVDMRALIENAIATTSGLFRENGTRVEFAVAGAIPLIRADPDRLTQVMVNLLSNAAKFVPAIDGRVDVGLRRERDGLVVEVRDNGPGVPAEERAKVFEKFRQGGDSLARPAGTGLGLPISRQIVEHFGGSIWLEANPGGGACFAFRLPFRTAARKTA
jgi:signal transduction histidine kinase